MDEVCRSIGADGFLDLEIIVNPKRLGQFHIEADRLH